MHSVAGEKELKYSLVYWLEFDAGSDNNTPSNHWEVYSDTNEFLLIPRTILNTSWINSWSVYQYCSSSPILFSENPLRYVR